MSAGGDTTQISIGPGRLWVATIGTAAPTSASAALPSAWWAIGYTEDGTTVDIEYTRDAIEVAEELDPVKFVNSARAVRFNLAMAQVTKRRLALALAMGPGYEDDAVYLDFPDADDEIVGCALIWDSAETADGNDDNVRWYIPSVNPTGNTSIARQKSPAKATLPIQLSAVKVTGSPIARVFPNAAGLV